MRYCVYCIIVLEGRKLKYCSGICKFRIDRAARRRVSKVRKGKNTVRYY